MKILGVIPARYDSSRFMGKPLADICGKPMIWWVYQQVKKNKRLSDVIIATDDIRIAEVCSSYQLNYIMTSRCNTSTERLYEVAKAVPANLYVCINGDEPLISPETIEAVLPYELPSDLFYVSNLMTAINDPAEVIDCTTIKVVTDSDQNALFMSRSPIPYPKGSMDYQYYKHIGVLVYDFAALEFFASTKRGKNESVEDINELRFIENGKKLKMIEVEHADTLSVDTPKDLDKVIAELKRRGLEWAR